MVGLKLLSSGKSDASGSGRNSLPENKSLPQSEQNNTRTTERFSIVDPRKSTNSYSNQIWDALDFFNKSEASRCQMAKEEKLAGAIFYYLNVRPPSPAEILEARHFIAELQKNTPANKKNEMDDRIGDLIKEYDPFGQLGRKLICIRIPDDPMKPLSAWTYPTEDVNKELERLSSGQQISAPENMQFYVASKTDNLFRFRSLISQPGKE